MAIHKNPHKKCLKIKISRPSHKGIGFYNVEGNKRCSYCEIFTTDKICPALMCPCCGRKFRRNQRWKTGSNLYGGKTMKSKLNYIKRTKRNAAIVGRLHEKSGNRKYQFE